MNDVYICITRKAPENILFDGVKPVFPLCCYYDILIDKLDADLETKPKKRLTMKRREES